jgi:tetratricopeptide (TPR) repeat protein
MVFKRGDALKMITQGLAWIKTTCDLQGQLKLFDDHLLAQPFFGRVLNVAYDLQLEVMDRIRQNYPAIDLGDRTNRVAFQVTTERRADKVQDTLDKFVEHGLQRDFDLLRILIIGEPQATYKTLVIPEELTFDCGRHILGISGLVKQIDTLATPRIIEIAGVFAEEVSHFSAPAGPTDEPSEEEEVLTSFLEQYLELLEKNRGYIIGQMTVLCQVTGLDAWQRGRVDGTFKQLKDLCDSRDTLMASAETAALIGSAGNLFPMLKRLLPASTEDDVRQRTAWRHWSRLTYQLGAGGPQSDEQVQAWQQGSLKFLDASLTALRTKERLVKEAIGRWRAEKAAMVQGNALYHRALEKAKAADRDGAYTDYEALLALPNLPGVVRAAALFDRALMRRKAGDGPGALAEYSALLETPDIHPHQYAKALLNRGVEKSQAGDSAGALADFDLLISLADAPSDQRAMAFFNRASLKNSAGDRRAAMADLDACLGLPGVPAAKRVRALLTRAAAKAESGDQAGALGDYDAILALHDVPQEYRVHASNLRDTLLDPSDSGCDN